MTRLSSDKSVQAIAAETGLPVRAAFSWGGYMYDFVYPDPSVPELHRHGWYSRKDRTWGVEDPAQTPHEEECAGWFPGYVNSRAQALAADRSHGLSVIP